MNRFLQLALALILAGLAPVAFAATPSCKLTPNPSTAAPEGMAIIKHTASCTGAVSVRFYDQLGDILTDRSAPFEVHIGISGANTSGVTRTFKLSAEACSGDVPAQCVKMSDTVTQAPLGAPPPPPPPPSPVSAPSCSAKASPSSLPASGGVVTLTASCTGSAVGSWTWKRSSDVVGRAAVSSVSVGANASTSSRTLTYQLTACAAEDASKCASASTSVTQSGAAPSPAPSPAPTPTPTPTPTPNPTPPPVASCTGSAPVVTRTQSCAAGYTGSILEQQVYACSNGQWVATATWQPTQNTCAPVGVPMAPVSAVEFYHAGLDHYFLSADAAEIAALDSGRFAGWMRTGYSFEVLPAASAPVAGSVPVCRYYGNPAEGLDSHFYTASAQECQYVGESWPTKWLFESGNVFQVVKTDTGTHACPSGATTVYRFFNNRKDVNHRYVVAEAAKAEMTARGWVPEGPAFCSVQ